jgi:hypothetical protein
MTDTKLLNEIAKEIHATAVEKGWWDGNTEPARYVDGEAVGFDITHPRSVGEVLALIHCEVSEAMEEYRAGHYALNKVRYVHPDGMVCDAESRCLSENGVSDTAKPEGFAIELADVIIRVLDAAAAWDIDIASAVAVKMVYNRTRPRRHGGKLA